MSISKGDRQLNKYCEETDEQKMTCKDCLKKELGYCKFDCTKPRKEAEEKYFGDFSYKKSQEYPTYVQ